MTAGDAEPQLEAAIAERIATLSIEEKVRLLTAPDFSGLRDEPKIGLGRMVVSDGPAGVRGHDWDERDPSQNIPGPTALGATWDERVVERMTTIMGHDARAKGVDISLAPCVNLQRAPHSGRFFEYFSEDPLLTGCIGAAYVRGLQKMGVAATVKHFVANDSETERQTADVIVDERTLREIYMLPFELIIGAARPWLIMSAYNNVNGHSMSESPLLRDVLKDEWGFDGVVMSDFLAAPPTVAAAASGLDIAMPWPRGGNWDDLLAQAVRSGELDEVVLDDKVARLMRLAFRCGVLGGFAGKPPVSTRDKAQEILDMRAAAASSFVLARNAGQLLPLDKDSLSSAAVIGPNALQGRANGGGSAKVYPAYVVSPLEGIMSALGGGAEVRFAEGVRPFCWEPIARAPWLTQPDRPDGGVLVEFLDADGAVLASERRNVGELAWIGHFGPDVAPTAVEQVRVRARIVAQEKGAHAIGMSGVGRFRFSLGGRQVLDEDLSLPPGADITEGFTFPPQRLFEASLDLGEAIDLEIVHQVGTFKPGSRLTMFQIRLGTPFGSEDEEIERAVALASTSDVAIVVVGNDIDADAEGHDREHLRLLGRQNELVRRVAEVNPRTVAIFNGAGPAILPWADEVAALLFAWLPGQELGDALADVLFGDREPGGRLPMTWPRHESGLASVSPVGGRLSYEEDLFIGYRGYDRDGREPQYAFGHGLGYTDWEYVEADTVSTVSAAAEEVVIAARVRNTGGRAGKETVQIYLSKPDSQVDRPVMWLAGFGNVTATAGSEAIAQIVLPLDRFRHWTSGGWQVELGKYVLHVGRSSRDLRLSRNVEVV